eukprot:1144051-Amphidinium_carterae.1
MFIGAFWATDLVLWEVDSLQSLLRSCTCAHAPQPYEVLLIPRIEYDTSARWAEAEGPNELKQMLDAYARGLINWSTQLQHRSSAGQKFLEHTHRQQVEI